MENELPTYRVDWWMRDVPDHIDHRIADHGAPCTSCGKPLRTPKATFCAACGMPKA